MKQLFIHLLIVSTCFCSAIAQDQIYAKIYHHSSFYQRSEIQYDQFNTNTGEYARLKQSYQDFNRFSLAVMLVNKRNWNNEIGVSFSRANQPVTHESWVPETDDHDKKNYSLQYELSKHLYSQGRIQLIGGLGASMYHTNAALTPEEGNSPGFKVTENYSRLTLHIIPRVMYAINSKFSLDANAKIGFFDLHHVRSRIDNPQLAARQRFLADNVKDNFLPSSFILRLGLTYVIK
ncbi:MAG: hypothetical protein R8G66_29420 [Cytophagales bacterium]|nr:hypothetical protein [Cytophagales bacterium]